MAVVYSRNGRILVRQVEKVVPKSLQKRGWGLVDEMEYDNLPPPAQAMFLKGDFHSPKSEQEVADLWREVEGYAKHYANRHASMFFIDKDDLMQEAFFIYVQLLEKYIPIYKRQLLVSEQSTDATTKNCRVYYKDRNGCEWFYKFFKLRPYLVKNLYFHSLNLAQKSGRHAKKFYHIHILDDDGVEDFDRLVYMMAHREFDTQLDRETSVKTRARVEKLMHQTIKTAIKDLPKYEKQVAQMYFLKDVGIDSLAEQAQQSVEQVRKTIGKIEDFLLKRPDIVGVRDLV